VAGHGSGFVKMGGHLTERSLGRTHSFPKRLALPGKKTKTAHLLNKHDKKGKKVGGIDT